MDEGCFDNTMGTLMLGHNVAQWYIIVTTFVQQAK